MPQNIFVIMEKIIKILAIVGSIRADSYNHQLAQEAGKIIGERADFEVLDYTDVPFFSQDIEYPAPASVVMIREKIMNSDAIWFFSPEYNHYFSGVLKNLIDWLSRPLSETIPQVLRGKPAAVSGIALGMFGTGIAQDHLVSLLSILNMKIMNQPRLTIPFAFQQVDDKGLLNLVNSRQFLEQQAEALLRFINESTPKSPNP